MTPARNNTLPLAKVSVPRLARHYPRTRLFDLLDQALESPAVWITAPAGMGKTTLAAGYVAARDLKCLWYSIDSGDSDPATFFHFLTQAAKKATPRKRRPLPKLTPDLLPGLPVFTRRFFEALYARLPPGALVVFDNCQDAGPDSPLPALLAEALSVIPEEIHFLLLSRETPPDTLARLRAHGGISSIGWETLRLTEDEARGIARLDPAPASDVDALLPDLYRQSEGWVAGLVLLLERARSGTVESAVPHISEREVLFDYFAKEVFERQARDTRTILTIAAVFPQFTGRMAEAITGQRGTERTFAKLARNGYFTYRSGRSPVTYHFHPLFRQFLLNRLERDLSAADRAALTAKAAGLLTEAGQVDEAARLIIASRDWAALATLICAHAPGLAEQSRLGVLAHWLEALPDEWFEKIPWLSYWCGVCHLSSSAVGARVHFERAFQGFEQTGDGAGLWLAWAGIAESFVIECHDFRAFKPWFDKLGELHRRFPDPPPEIMGRVAPTALGALLWWDPQAPDKDLWEERAHRLIPLIENPDLRILAVNNLVFGYSWQGRHREMRDLIDLSRADVAAGRVSPGAEAMWWMVEAMYGWNTADFETCEAAVEKCLDLVNRFGIQHIMLFLTGHRLHSAVCRGDWEQVDRFLREDEICLQRHPSTMMQAHWHCMMSWRRGLLGDFPGALSHYQISDKLIREVGAPIPRLVNQTGLAQVLLDSGDLDGAREVAEEARLKSIELSSGHQLFAATVAVAQAAHRMGDEEGTRKALEEAFATGREWDFNNHCWWRADVMSKVCSWALERGIETDYVRRLIRERDLLPEQPPLAEKAWPWPVSIHALGPWRVDVAGSPLRFSRKTQKRPMELLQLMVATGARGVSESRATEFLWPDKDGDAARKALRTALYRLRKLVGAAAVGTQDGWIKLDRRRCWVDLWAVQEILVQLATIPHAERPSMALLNAVMEMRRGTFLEGTHPTVWSIPVQAKLDDEIKRVVRRIAGALCSDHRHDEALRLFEWLLTIAPYSEPVYQDLMTCHAHAGRQADALATYDRLKRMLAQGLKVTPSEETVHLAKSIRNKG